ncbi:Rv1733c family protein [Streptomyces sp. NPDC003514]
MAASESTKVRLWRWRSNPLKRRSDVIEAWVVLCAWLLAVLGGVFAGFAAADAVVGSAERVRAETRRVTAVLVRDAEEPGPARVSTDHLVWAPVRWSDPDGTTRTDEARVPPKAKAGGKVQVWTDRHGRVVNEPLSVAETTLHAVSGGLLAGAGAAGVVLGAGWVVRLMMDRRRLEQWAAEWERLDTHRGWKTG